MSTTMDSKLASLLIIFFDFTDFFLLMRPMVGKELILHQE